MTSKAFISGAAKFDWWKDWRGECVAIVASGPSTKKIDVQALRNRIHVAAIKENGIEPCPWADVLYGCDAPWWINRRGAPDFKGLKLAFDPSVPRKFPDVKRVEIKDKTLDRLLFDEPLVVGAGGNSGFQLLNIVLQFGVTAVLLIGFDAHDRGGVHWYGRNSGMGMNNPCETNFVRWRRAFDGVAAGLGRMGIDVVNASMDSTINAFPKMSPEAALKRWGL